MAIASGLLPQIKCNKTLNQTVYSRLQKQASSFCYHTQAYVTEKWFKFMQRHCWKDVSCGALEKLEEWLWITRKSTLLNWHSSTVNIRENRSGKYLKLLKYSTASLYREPALGLPFGQNLRHDLCSTRPWGSDTETLVVYGLLLDIYSPSMTTWICNSTCWGRCIPISSHCLVWVFVPALVFDPIWDFIFCMLLLELDTHMTIICLSANSWNV